MIIKASVFIATSLDGFIARDDGRIDWLERANARVPAGEDCGYQEFIATIDVLVMGRKSFETVLGFDSWPYENKKVVVLSRNAIDIPSHLRTMVSWTSESPSALMHRLSSQGSHHVYVDGGTTIQGFLRAGLIDNITITVIPRLLGSGRQLFGPIGEDVALELVGTRSFPFGFVQLHYRIPK